MNKKELRELTKKNRDLVSMELREKWSHMIFNQVIYSENFKQAKQVLIYVTTQSEVSTREIINTALDLGKEVFVPRVLGQDMDFYQITSLEDLAEGCFHVFEPKEVCPIWQLDNRKQIVLYVPLVAFDLKGNRLGYGKGYYDRFLKRFLILNPIALAYECQLVNQIPADSFDKPLTEIITEHKYYVISQDNK